MRRKLQADVVVVGAGPVGLFAALCLAERGLSVSIVDKASRGATHSYALGLHPGSLELLDRLGLAPEIVEGGYKVERVAFYDGGVRAGEVALADLPVDFPFVLVLPQSRLEQLLAEKLTVAGVRVVRDYRMSNLLPGKDRVDVSIDELEHVSAGYATATMEWVVRKTHRVAPQFVIGADGFSSLVRKLLDIEFAQTAVPERYAVFEFDADFAIDHEVRVFFHEGTTNVLWPLPDGGFRFSFQIPDDAAAPETAGAPEAMVQLGSQAFPILDHDQLGTLIRERAPWFAARPGRVRWALRVRFEQRLAERFGEGRVWLAGDAAHLSGPVGMRSMNVGLSEAHDLTHAIGEIVLGRAGLDALETYGRERQAEWAELLGGGARPVAASAAPEWVSRNAARVLACLPAAGEALELITERLGLKVSAS